MGRKSKGAKCTYEILKLDLRQLLGRQIKPGYRSESVYSWTKKGRWDDEGVEVASVKLQTFLLPDSSAGFITLLYKEGETVQENIIRLVSVPSNLGKGNVSYFECPQTGRRSRVLYRCYGSSIWKSREAYKRRIYYECQHSSKMNWANNRWWQIEDMLPKIETRIRRSKTYAGKPTRRAQRIEMLLDKQHGFEELRWGLDSMRHTLRNEMKELMKKPDFAYP